MIPRLIFSQRRAAAYHQLRKLKSESLFFSRPRTVLQQPTSSPRHVHGHRDFETTTALRMASDDSYLAFLEKAQRDREAGAAGSQGGGGGRAAAAAAAAEFKSLDEGAVVPAVIHSATKDAFYVSDADEPFVPVSLAWDEAGKGLPDEEEFATLINHPDPVNADIQIQDPADWDTQGEYGTIIDAVSEAGKGNDVQVYRVAKGGVRVEYWVVTTDGKGKGARLVGAKALAIES
ncbi:hypothetical protein GGS21DRAFT_501784 [Xylaria nigripes]|nr:hypothetical protein GGS21DRAFT_501784 [Xylaria nigripes]